MTSPSAIRRWGWIAALGVALAFAFWGSVRRAQRVERISALPVWSTDAPVTDAKSPTGYAAGRRRLIVPAHDNDSYRTIALVQQMREHGTLRVRDLDSENAPHGRPVYSASPHRWWLCLVAWLDGIISGRSVGLAVEHAALSADPLLLLLGLVASTLFVRWRFGPDAAAVFAPGFVLLFPFAGGFLPGAPDSRGLTSLLVLGSALAMLAGLMRSQHGPAPAMRRWFALAGALGGAAVWSGVGDAFPAIAGIGFGAVAAGAAGRRQPPELRADAACWRMWSLAGAITILIGYLVEFFPDHLGSLRLRTVHPVYGVALIGLGELAAWCAGASGDRAVAPRKPVRSLHLLGALATVAVLPIAIVWSGERGFLAADLGSFRLTNLDDGVFATGLGVWLAADGATPEIWATLLPVLLLAPAVWLAWRTTTDARARAALVVLLPAAAVSVGIACVHLRGWQTADAVLLALAVPVVQALRAPATRGAALFAAAGAAAALACGAWSLAPSGAPAGRLNLTETETRSLLERDFAHWLSQRTGPAGGTIIAPPDLTASLAFHGGLRTLGTLAWENEPGMAAAVRILGATSPDEALALIGQRAVTHIVVPSWDNALDAYAGARPGTFLAALHDWEPPPWIQPVAYPLPVDELFAGKSITVFAVVDDQPEVLALSRLAEYFAETDQRGLAEAATAQLTRFASDPGALAARASVAIAQQDLTGLARIAAALPPLLERRADRYLTWDRRVSLAAVLLQVRQRDRALEQTKRCLAELDEAKLRSLSPAALGRFLVVLHRLELKIEPPALHALALDLLPPAARGRL